MKSYDEMINSIDFENLKQEIILWIRQWFEENGTDCNAVVGISGGKDSSVVAALCTLALGKDRVLGVLMPNGNQADIEDSIALVEFLGIPFTQIDISKSYRGILDEMDSIYIQQDDGSRIGRGFFPTLQTYINLAPRIRMAALYAISQSVNGRVANTCNLSEDWVGYSTRYGDSVGGFSPLSKLTTDEVIGIGLACGLPESLVKKPPSDGLCGKTDEDNLGFTYRQLNEYIRSGVCNSEKVKKLIDTKHDRNLFKLLPMPVFQPSQGDICYK